MSASTFDNLHDIVRKLIGADKARSALRQMRGIFSVVTVDAKITNLALDSTIDDFEDAIQCYSWVRSKAKLLLTRNVADFPKHPRRIISPADFVT